MGIWPQLPLGASEGPRHALSLGPNPDKWRAVLRLIAPLISRAAFEAMAKGLSDDDPRILQGMTCSPPPYCTCGGLPLGAADPLVFGAWMSGACAFVREAEVWLEPLRAMAGDDWRFLEHWIDETDRDVMRAMLIEEIEQILSERQ